MGHPPRDIEGAVDRVGQSPSERGVQGRGDPGAARPVWCPQPGARPAEHGDLTATRDLLSELFPVPGHRFIRSRIRRTRRGVRPERLGRRIRQNFGLTPRVTETASYPDDREPPDPQDEPPYPDDAEPTTA